VYTSFLVYNVTVGLSCVCYKYMFCISLLRKEWLSSIGSPRSRIDRCEFKREKVIDRTEYSSFNIRK
jgi:hypothetical protein